MSIIDWIVKRLGGLPVKVHFHELPKCSERPNHHVGCRDKGPEVTCNVLFKGDKRICACTHVKIG